MKGQNELKISTLSHLSNIAAIMFIRLHILRNKQFISKIVFAMENKEVEVSLFCEISVFLPFQVILCIRCINIGEYGIGPIHLYNYTRDATKWWRV